MARMFSKYVIIIASIIIYGTGYAQKMGPYTMTNTHSAGGYGLADSLGNQLFEPGEYANLFLLFDDGEKRLFSFTDTTTYLQGIISQSGDTVSKAVWSHIFGYREGVAIVVAATATSETGFTFGFSDGLKGCIDTSGRVVIPIKYTYIGDFNDSAAVFSTAPYNAHSKGNTAKTAKLTLPFKGLFGLLKSNSEIILPPTYDFIDPYISSDNKLYYLVRRGRNYGAIDSRGRQVVEVVHKKFSDVYHILNTK